MDIKRELAGLRENVPLKQHTTFKIGGPARYFYIAKTKNNLIKSVQVALKLKLPFFVLAGGSNILIRDEGFNGLVIKNETRNFKIEKEKIIAESGASLAEITEASVRAGLKGLAEAAGIPGTIGGAIYGNAGWPKGAWAIGDVAESAEILMPDGKVKKVSKKWLDFGYRESRLKKEKDVLILEATLKLQKGDAKKLKQRTQEILKTRNGKIPTGFSAGSVFKNPEEKSAGFLIEQCGLKGKKIGRAKISEKHANFIINLGNATANDVLALIQLAKKEVKNKFKITLEEEIIIIS